MFSYFNKIGLDLYQDAEWRFYDISDAQLTKQEIWEKLGLNLLCDVNELSNKIGNSDDIKVVFTPNVDVDGETCDGILFIVKFLIQNQIKER